jgi:hypothetical protein
MKRVRGYIAPPKMKVKGYMYPQMKKPVGRSDRKCGSL